MCTVQAIDHTNDPSPNDDNGRCVNCGTPGAYESAFCSTKCQDATLAELDAANAAEVARLEALYITVTDGWKAECRENEDLGRFCIYCDL